MAFVLQKPFDAFEFRDFAVEECVAPVAVDDELLQVFVPFDGREEGGGFVLYRFGFGDGFGWVVAVLVPFEVVEGLLDGFGVGGLHCDDTVDDVVGEFEAVASFAVVVAGEEVVRVLGSGVADLLAVVEDDVVLLDGGGAFGKVEGLVDAEFVIGFAENVVHKRFLLSSHIV